MDCGLHKERVFRYRVSRVWDKNKEESNGITEETVDQKSAQHGRTRDLIPRENHPFQGI